MPSKKIPEKTVERLCLYARIVSDLEQKGIKSISSVELGEYADLTDTQIRKDLSFFGQFGTSGKGYDVAVLKAELNKILGKNRPLRIALVGVGRLGSALLEYPGFRKYGFEIVAAFDSDNAKVGKRLGVVPILPIKDLQRQVAEKKIAVGILAVSEESAQRVARQLVDAGIKYILNFSPQRLDVPKGVRVRNVDLSMELECFSYFMNTGE